jgi:predicted adenine nucleotide alpha hydrolase (AANH) superfamily ATPase
MNQSNDSFKKDVIEFYRYVNLYSEYTDKKYTTRLCDIDKFIEEHNVDLNNNSYTYDITKYKRDIKKVIRGKVKYAYGLSLV